MAPQRRRRRRSRGRARAGAAGAASSPNSAVEGTAEGPSASPQTVSQPGAHVTPATAARPNTILGIPRLMFGIISGSFIALIAVIVLQQVVSEPEDRLAVAGAVRSPDQGRRHLSPGELFSGYNSTPPTSGPHDPAGVAPGIYDEPQRAEALVQVLEQGGIVIYYSPERVGDTPPTALRDFVQRRLGRDQNVVLTPHNDIEPAIVATAWRHRLALDVYDETSLAAFSSAYYLLVRFTERDPTIEVGVEADE